MNAYLRLVRLPHLLFLALAQGLMRQAVIMPVLQVHGFEATPPGIGTALLIVATVCIAAGGYVLNDYFDVKIDAINRPDRLIVTREVSRQAAMRLYQALTGVGVVCGLALAWRVHSLTLAFIFAVIPGLLWFCSAGYKRQFLIGNLVVAFATALSLLVVAIAETAALQARYGTLLLETPLPRLLYGWTGGYAVFAFLLTWMEEMIKDMESERGDREMECRTLPIRWGVKKSKWLLCGLIALAIVALAVAMVCYVPFDGTLTFRYLLIGVILPLIILGGLVFRSNTPAEYRQASGLVRFIMLAGLLYSLVAYYLQAQAYGILLFGLFRVDFCSVLTRPHLYLSL